MKPPLISILNGMLVFERNLLSILFRKKWSTDQSSPKIQRIIEHFCLFYSFCIWSFLTTYNLKNLDPCHQLEVETCRWFFIIHIPKSFLIGCQIHIIPMNTMIFFSTTSQDDLTRLKTIQYTLRGILVTWFNQLEKVRGRIFTPHFLHNLKSM